MDVVGQGAVRRVEQPGIVVEPPVGAVTAAARVGIEREAPGERLGALLELLDAGELVAQRPLELCRLAVQEGQAETSVDQRIGQVGLRVRPGASGGPAGTMSRSGAPPWWSVPAARRGIACAGAARRPRRPGRRGDGGHASSG
jgi:hypothetical protein